MIDWTKSMQQTYEYYVVDPLTWKDSYPLTNIESSTINRDSSNVTLGSATIDCTETLNECYVRIYLVVNQLQNGIMVNDKIALGTFLVQTPAVGFDGKKKKISLDAYTPLIELKETPPAIGYSLLEGTAIMDTAYTICRENMRAPVAIPSDTEKLHSSFVSNLDDNWLTFVADLISNAKYQFSLDGMGAVTFDKVLDIGSLRPVWTYDDGNSSILYPEIDDSRDLYNVPNVVEVIYSTGTRYMISRIVNNDPNSPVSVVSRGREKIHRVNNPSLSFNPTQAYLDNYATQLLRDMSCLEHTITYTHGYCPVRIGDGVLLNYERAGLKNIKAKVISQSIKCTTGCSVEETAVYTENLWR